MAFPPGLGGAIAITESLLGAVERTGECFLSKNLREMLGFEDKLMGETKREEESLMLALFFEEGEGEVK